MSDNKEQVQRDEDGFIKLVRKKQTQTEAQTQAEKDTSPSKPDHAEIASKESTKSAREENSKPKEQKYTFLRWVYDDGVTYGSILNRGKKYILPITVKCNQTEEMEKCKKKLNKFKIKKKQDLKLPVGLKYLAEKHRASILQADLNQSNFDEFLKMVQPGMESTQRRTVLQLVCTILSSYCIRRIIESPIIHDYNLDPEELHAFCTSITYCENAYYALKKIAESVIIDTHIKSDNFKIQTATVIPEGRESCSIQDDTFLMVRGYKDEDDYWPAPYRDTAVVLDARKLKKSDIVEFASINPWCSCIIYGKKFSIPFRYNEHIEGSPLANMVLDWAEEQVHDLVEAYAAELYDAMTTNVLESLWQRVGKYLQQYINSKKCKMSPAERFRKRVELFALETFLNFCKYKCAIPEENFQGAKCSLLNILLPGCCLPPVSEAEIESKNSEMGNSPNFIQRDTPQQVFQGILTKMLQPENRKHFLFVAAGEKFDRVNPDDPACEYWGYLRMFSPSNDHAKEFPALCFRKKDFEKVALNILGSPDPSAKELIKSLRKETPDYLHDVVKGRFPTGTKEDNGSVDAITLDIRKMSFLPEDQSAYLREYFSDNTLQTTPKIGN